MPVVVTLPKPTWPLRRPGARAVTGSAAVVVTVLALAAGSVAHPEPDPVTPVRLAVAGPDRVPVVSVAAGGPGPSGQLTPLVAQPAPTSSTPYRQRVLAAAVPGRLGIPATVLGAYRAAVDAMNRADRTCRLHWSLLAAIGHVESRHATFGGSRPGSDGRVSPPILGIPLDGRPGVARIGDSDGGRLDGDTVHDRAVGPMQFIPGTWAAFGRDGDGDGRADPQNVFDAALAAAAYLCAGPGDLSRPDDARRAVLRYNASSAYADRVLALAATYRAGTAPLDDFPGPAPATVTVTLTVPATRTVTVTASPTATVTVTTSPTATITTSPTATITTSPTATITTSPTASPTATITTSPTATTSPTCPPPSSTETPTGGPTSSPVSPAASPTSASGSPTQTQVPTSGPTGDPCATATAIP